MYLEVYQLLLASAIGGLFFWWSGLQTYASSHRRYHRLKVHERTQRDLLLAQRLELIQDLESDVKRKTKAIQDLVYIAHHSGPSPRISTARGLLNLVRLATPDGSVQTYVDMTDKELVAARAEWMAIFQELEKLQ